MSTLVTHFCFLLTIFIHDHDSLLLSHRTVVDIISSECVDALKNIHQKVSVPCKCCFKLNKLRSKCSLLLIFIC